MVMGESGLYIVKDSPECDRGKTESLCDLCGAKNTRACILVIGKELVFKESNDE